MTINDDSLAGLKGDPPYKPEKCIVPQSALKRKETSQLARRVGKERKSFQSHLKKPRCAGGVYPKRESPRLLARPATFNAARGGEGKKFTYPSKGRAKGKGVGAGSV